MPEWAGEPGNASVVLALGLVEGVPADVVGHDDSPYGAGVRRDACLAVPANRIRARCHRQLLTGCGDTTTRSICARACRLAAPLAG